MSANKLTLLTNIDSIRYGDLRLEAHALLIEEGVEDIFDRNAEYRPNRIRGFGMDGSWPVFTLWQMPPVGAWDLSAIDSSGHVVVAGDDINDAKPLFSGYNLRLSDGRTLFLQSADSSQPIDIVNDVTDIVEIWNVLSIKAYTYWHAPNAPFITWSPAPNRRDRWKTK